MMHMAGFKQAVKKLAKGRYHSVAYDIVEYHTGEIRHEWRAYIDGTSWTRRYVIPEEALKELEKMCSTLK